ncbi:uncharacterized protein LOC126890283 [Diabrotica virgifera virgifera]|uniref:Ionotropic receptor 75a N-terminal domain-containing protein n=1 Tax=Diabrotica virgifera virgifera TaxID=50390 RepID=A0ABM5KY27_DIAVI|nr:uncharacterized protein LOC126890283 [Diabrotica virgifera virgifera]
MGLYHMLTEVYSQLQNRSSKHFITTLKKKILRHLGNEVSESEGESSQKRFQLAKSLIFGNQTMAFGNINNISYIQKSLLFFHTTHKHIGVIIDGDCDENMTKHFLAECGKNYYFHVKYHWLIMTTNLLFTQYFENVELYLNSDINILYKSFENGLNIYKLEDTYNPASMKGGQLKRRNMGFYTNTVDGFKKDQESKYWLRRNLTGITLKSMLVAPFNFEGPLEEYFQNKSVNVLDLNLKNYNKFQYQIVGYCADYYNYTNKVILVKTWGYQRPDGTFDGMVGALSTREIDYGSPLILRADRARFVQYGGLTFMLSLTS